MVDLCNSSDTFIDIPIIGMFTSLEAILMIQEF